MAMNTGSLLAKQAGNYAFTSQRYAENSDSVYNSLRCAERRQLN